MDDSQASYPFPNHMVRTPEPGALQLLPAGATLPLVRRSACSRVATAVMTAWLTFNIADPAGLHAHCPVHGAGGGAHSASAHFHGSHARHHGHGPAPVSHHESDPAQHQCCCFGACCCAAALTVTPDRLVALPVVPVVVVRPTVARTDEAPRITRSDVVLPPPVGPPSLEV
jgi:hypothetical protein